MKLHIGAPQKYFKNDYTTHFGMLGVVENLVKYVIHLYEEIEIIKSFLSSQGAKGANNLINPFWVIRNFLEIKRIQMTYQSFEMILYCI
jgi:hypothetical protein